MVEAALALSAFDALPMQAAVLDEDGVIRETNRAWECFGVENDLQGSPDSVGENYLAVSEDDESGDGPNVAEGIRDVLAGEQDGFEYEYPCHTPDEDRWFSMRAIRFEHGGEPHALVVHVDITERKLAELAIGEHNDRLEALASMISHDIRNPLTVLEGHLELVADDLGEDHLAPMERSIQRMETIIEDSLVLARGTEVTDLTTVSLEASATDAWELVETGDATLTVATDREFRADPDLLAHVLENLFRNAIEHASDDASVTVGATGAGFYVADDGPGIPPDERAQVFEMGHTTSEDGSGLGLSIVAEIADAHGWTVTVTDAEGGGARFEFAGVEAA